MYTEISKHNLHSLFSHSLHHHFLLHACTHTLLTPPTFFSPLSAFFFIFSLLLLHLPFSFLFPLSLLLCWSSCADLVLFFPFSSSCCLLFLPHSILFPFHTSVFRILDEVKGPVPILLVPL